MNRNACGERRHRAIAAAALIVALVGGLQVRAAEPSSQPATATSAPNEVKIVYMRLHPAPQPTDALKYHLLPNLLERNESDGVQLYYQAMTTLGDTKLSDRAYDLLDLPLDQLSLKEAKEVLSPGPLFYSLRLVDEAARSNRVEWYFSMNGGINMSLPPLSRLRTICRAVDLDARIRLTEGKTDEALHDIQTGLGMAQHTARGPVLIMSLVGTACATLTLKQVEDLVQQPQTPNLYWALAALPRPFIDERLALEGEKNWLYVCYPLLKDVRDGRPTTAEQWRQFEPQLDELLAGLSEQTPHLSSTAMAVKLYPQAKAYLLSKGYTTQQIEAMPVMAVVMTKAIREYERLKDEMFKWFAFPYAQASNGLKEVKKKLAEANQSGEGYPFVEMLPSLSRAYLLPARLDRQINALQIVEAIRMYAAGHDNQLPNSLEEIKEVPIPLDPVTGKSFDYTVKDGTAVLESPPADEGDPRTARGDLRTALRYEMTIVK